MKITNILKNDAVQLSYEFFPPKTDAPFEPVLAALEETSSLKPSFFSVTYGASGGASANTLKVAQSMQDDYKIPALAHLTCVISNKATIDEKLDEIEELNIKNVLALRGDIPQTEGFNRQTDFMHASDLIAYIKENRDLCVGGACYPEGHPESEDKNADILTLKLKQDAGVDFLTTQMFFDNNLFYNFMYRLRDKGVTVPIIPAIMPVTNVSQLKRIKELSGAILPSKFIAIADRFKDDPEAMMQAGIIYANNQIIDLISNGFNNIHIYTMNKGSIAKSIHDNLSNILS